MLLLAEWWTWRASRDVLLPGRRSPRSRIAGEVVLVLGVPGRRDGRPSAMQRWRVRIAVRSSDASTARFVFSGGAPRGGRTEAAVMAEYAVSVLGVPPGAITLEEHSRSTRENVAFALPLLADAPAVEVASNTFHARRARRYLLQASPDIGSRLARGGDHRFGELLPLKPLLVMYEWRRAIRSWRAAHVDRRGSTG